MTTPASEWQALCEEFTDFSRQIDKTGTANVNAQSLRNRALTVAQHYFRETRPVLQNLGLDSELSALDAAFENLIQLAAGMNATSTYKKLTKTIRKLQPSITTRIELNQSVGKGTPNNTAEDQRLIETLDGLVPSAALSYRQAIIDLADTKRLSFRGPALELREALRETLDHLAPDKEVTASPSFTLEKDRNGPTMKQKIRFILKARGQSKSASEVPEKATTTIDEMIGNLTRSVYDRSSVATHVALEQKAVAQIRRYVVAVLHDILEL